MRVLERFCLVAYIAWMSVILWLSLDSNPPEINLGALSWDKLEHAAGYALLTLLGLGALRPFFQSGRRGAAVAVFISILFGTAMEVGQGVLTTTRTADPFDLLANTVGACAALLFASVLRALKKGTKAAHRN